MTSVIISSSSSSSLSSNTKYILVVNHDLSDESEKKSFENDVSLIKKQSIAIHIFDYLSDSNRTLSELMESAEMLIINIADAKTKVYYNGCGENIKNAGESLVVLYQYEPHTHISEKEKKDIKDTFFVDYVLKYIPTEQYKTKREFLTNMCNDHMHKQKKSVCEKVLKVINIFTKN